MNTNQHRLERGWYTFLFVFFALSWCFIKFPLSSFLPFRKLSAKPLQITDKKCRDAMKKLENLK